MKYRSHKDTLKLVTSLALMVFFLAGCENQSDAPGASATTDAGSWRDSAEPPSTSALGYAATDTTNNSGALGAINDAINRNPVPSATTSSQGGMTLAQAQNAHRQSRLTGVTGGNCGRGVRMLLGRLGYPHNGQGHGTMWSGILSSTPGWERVSCSAPSQCPLGSVMVYNATGMAPGQFRNGASVGANYGHVEMVTADASGNRSYCYGSCSPNPGGSVPRNFHGAWIYRGQR